MATFTTTSGKRLTKADSSSSADTYVVSSDSLGLVLTGNASGDTIKIDGLSTDFTFKASGKTLTLTSIDTPTFKIQVQIAAGGSVTLGFLDGGFTAAYASSGAAKGVTLGGVQKLTTKAAELGSTVTVDEAKASVSTFDTTTATTTTTGSGYALSTNVDGISGSAGNDTISGIIAASGTFTIGDDIFGGSGTDTLNLIALDHNTDSVFASINGVEAVNIRQLGSAADALVMNAVNWSGVASLSNASSLAATTLTVTGVEVATNIRLEGNTDINVAFRNSTTAGPVGITLVGAGSADGASTLASATANGTANIDLDQADAGLISGVTVTLSGTNLARLEAGSNVLTYTIQGSGNSILVTDDTMTSFDASAAQGNVDITLQGASDVTVKGGAGADTFRFGTTISNGDSVVGGAGSDTVTATIGGFNRSLNTSGVETATITFNDDAGGTVNASSSTVATFNAVAGSAGADAAFSNLATGSVVSVGSDNLDDVTLGYSSAAVGTLNIGSASGSVAVDQVNVSGVAALTINGIGGTAGAGSVSTFSADSTLTALTIQSSGGEADLTFTTASGAGVTTLTILANGSGAITLTSGFDAGSALKTVVVVASGDAADVTLGAVAAANTALSSVTLTGNSAGDVTVGALQFGNGATADAAGTLTLNAANGSVVGTTAMDISASGSFSLTIAVNASASGSVAIGDILFSAGTASTAASAASLTINAGTIGNNGSVRVEKINFEAGTAGQKLNIGTVVLGTTAGFEIGASGISADGVNNIAISTTNITVGADASATIGSGGIFTTGGSVGAITLTVADSGSARFGNIFASAVGAIVARASGDGEVDIGGITGTDAIGAITLVAQGEADVHIGAISGSGTVGAINIGVEVSASAVFSTIAGTSVGAITVSGAGYVSFGAITANSIGLVDATQMTSGTFIIDLSGVTRAAEVKLGAASANTVISGVGNDVITLLGGKTAVSGNDHIRYTTATQGTDNIVNFIAGNSASGGDVIEFGTGFAGASAGIIVGSSLATDSTTVVVALATTASGAITIGSGVSVVLVNATAFASTAAMVSALATGGSLEVNRAAGDAGTTAGSIVVVWTDGSDSYVSLVGVTAGASGTNALIENGSALQTVAIITGVTPGAFVAANFDFV